MNRTVLRFELYKFLTDRVVPFTWEEFNEVYEHLVVYEQTDGVTYE